MLRSWAAVRMLFEKGQGFFSLPWVPRWRWIKRVAVGGASIVSSSVMSSARLQGNVGDEARDSHRVRIGGAIDCGKGSL